MAERKSFLLRLEPRTMEALQHWASDELRSLNGQIEFLLRRALADAGRLRAEAGDRPPEAGGARDPAPPSAAGGSPGAHGPPRGAGPPG